MKGKIASSNVPLGYCLWPNFPELYLLSFVWDSVLLEWYHNKYLGYFHDYNRSTVYTYLVYIFHNIIKLIILLD